METEAHQRRGIVRFFSNPAIGIAGSMASIIGLVLAVYFYKAARNERELMFFVHPARAVVATPGQTSRLQITLDGTPIDRNVTAAQVAFWNAGAESIRQDNMLRRLAIRTGPKSQILEARLRKVSRGVSNIDLDLTRIGDGEVGINWRILEHNDGGIVQVIYLGEPDVPITAMATVEGQGEVQSIGFSGTPERYKNTGRSLKLLGFAYLAIGALMGALALYRSRTRRYTAPRFLKLWYAVGPVAMFIMGLIVVFWLGNKPGPPFGFE